MWRTYLEARRRGALAGQGYDGLKLTVERLQAELASKDARIAELEALLAGSLLPHHRPSPSRRLMSLHRLNLGANTCCAVVIRGRAMVKDMVGLRFSPPRSRSLRRLPNGRFAAISLGPV
jgi:hypothetical protein